MNSKSKRQEAQEQITDVTAGIANLAVRCTKLQCQSEPIKARISELEREIKARDWVLTGSRPKGCTETTNDAAETRRQLYEERNSLAHKLNELVRKLKPMTQELARMRCDLDTLQRLAISPESVQAEIDASSEKLNELESERDALVSVLNNAEAQLREISEAELEEADATKRLSEARAQSFFASPPTAATVKRAIAEAEKNLDHCREKAMEARAARPLVHANIENAKAELSSIDEHLEQQKIHLREKQSQLWKMEAYQEWEEILPRIRKALRKILHADRAVGRALVEALMHEGLKEFNNDGRLIRPTWLRSGASDLSNI